MNIVYDKKKQINDIVSVVKLMSLLFSAMVFFNFMTNYYELAVDNLDYIIMMNLVIVPVFVLVLVYALWAFSTIKKFPERYVARIHLVENFVFILIFFVIILITDAEKSDFKFLFLFIIITATIQSGIKQGMVNALLSSIIILAIDLVNGPSSVEDLYFEKDLIMSGVFILTAWIIGFYVRTEGDHIKKLESLVNEDGLTEVYNHRFFHDDLRKKLISHEKDNKSISLVFIDLDRFKHYNDLYGHQKGDEVLKIIGRLLKTNVREDDVVARYGGDEFTIILPDTSEQDAIKIAENIRIKIEDTYFEGEENQPRGKLTASIGIAVFPDKAKNEVELIKYADDALYRAKFFNKNRVEAYYSILDDLKEDIEDKHIDLVTSIKTLISVINAKDRYTYGHVERVVVYSNLLAEKLELSEKDKKRLIYGAYMHDIGKMNIPEEILNKRMPLTKEELELLKQHPKYGAEIIKPVEALMDLSSLILHHHERYDGTGYPGNLKCEDIPHLARVLTVVDSFDAMTSNRPYSNRKTHEEAIEELKRYSGTQFDPFIVKEFIEVIEENKDNINIKV
jgi:diguanylate cyclase (GGDEF)-like protein